MTQSRQPWNPSVSPAAQSGPARIPHGIQPPAFRLPAETRLGPVRLQVGDLRRSLAYYQEVLGLAVQSEATGRAVLSAQGDVRPLVILEERRDARPLTRRGNLGLYHFAILVPDRPSLGRFIAHLSAIRAYAGMSDHGVSEAVYLTDPDGLGIEVYADRPRASWSYTGRQLNMVTEPLDARDVVRAGAGERWAGMPAGTVIGHVHLHVASLEEAAAFYHSALGFDKVVWDYPGALFLSAGGYHHHLGTNTWAAGQPAGDDQPRLLSWDIVVPGAAHADAAAASLRASGYAVAPIPGGWTAADPWGTTLRIVY